MLPEKSWTPIWSRTRASSNCAKWPSMARSTCCEASATRATTSSKSCGQNNFELHPATLICGQGAAAAKDPREADHAHLARHVAGNSASSWPSLSLPETTATPFLVHQIRSRLWPDAAVARTCRKSSDALALRSDRLDPIRERL